MTSMSELQSSQEGFPMGLGAFLLDKHDMKLARIATPQDPGDLHSTSIAQIENKTFQLLKFFAGLDAWLAIRLI